MNDNYHHIVKKGDRATYKMIQEYYFTKGYVWCSTGKGLWFPDSMDRREVQTIGVNVDSKTLSVTAYGDVQSNPSLIPEDGPKSTAPTLSSSRFNAIA